MKALDSLIEKAKTQPRRIVLAEGDDPRVLGAAVRAVHDNTAVPVLIGEPRAIELALRERGAKPDRFCIVDLKTSDLRLAFIDEYLDIRSAKGASEADAVKAMMDPMGFAAMMVRKGEADGMVGGAVATTAHTVRTALQIIGRAPGTKIVSSFFLIMLCAPHHDRNGAFLFADCGMVVDPDADELAEIACATAHSWQILTDEQPRIAMLSFSTAGSASGAKVDKVVEATAKVRRLNPDLLIDGEFQFDAAFVPAVAAAKAPMASIQGDANIFIFPNLDAGNIGYKIAQRIGGAIAVGPVLQGLEKPANDLSRGCNAEDIHSIIAVTAIQAANALATKPA